jgi:hypothetical protein
MVPSIDQMRNLGGGTFEKRDATGVAAKPEGRKIRRLPASSIGCFERPDEPEANGSNTAEKAVRRHSQSVRPRRKVLWGLW